MEYRPRYNQPFSLEQAILLDVATITEEIARLQNSLQHLQRTQEMLRAHVVSEAAPDPELATALEENELVIGSQEERIGMLRLALGRKGVPTSQHYDLPGGTAQDAASEPQALQNPAAATTLPRNETSPLAPMVNGHVGGAEDDESEGGIHL